MRTFQFWILVLGATMVSLLMLKNISLTRHLNQAERKLIENQQLAAIAPQYENAWKTLAMHIYQSSKTDPDLAALLKNADVQIRSEADPTPVGGVGAQTPAPGSAPAPAPAPAPAAKAPSAP